MSDSEKDAVQIANMSDSEQEDAVVAKAAAKQARKLQKKEKATKKESRKASKKGDEVIDDSDSDNKSSSKKRKRFTDDKSAEGSDSDDENKLEIDINAAEPPSKKAKRQLLKDQKRAQRAAAKQTTTADSTSQAVEPTKPAPAPASQTTQKNGAAFGIWIGNLPWSAKQEDIRQFFTEKASIPANAITRCYAPPPRAENVDPKRALKPQNRGFAYVDFSNKELRDKAIELSDTLLNGRKVLIKDSKSFEGRPDAHTTASTTTNPGAPKAAGKPPSQRIFVGNLGFDISRDDLLTHFAQAGEVEDLHMATFEDTGKCKGFAWVRFKELEAAEAAVRGFIRKRPDDASDSSTDSEDDSGSGSDDEGVHPERRKRNKSAPKQKWYINRLHGRQMRCEFAEDAQTRYKKRYHANAPTDQKPADRRRPAPTGDEGDETHGRGGKMTTGDWAANGGGKVRKSGDKEQRRAERAKRHIDARSVKPGAALAGAKRNTGAIVEAAGTKKTYD
ncbi:hypothetical protein MBLNU230_g3859t1 [Neophaeotheca triangularis]